MLTSIIIPAYNAEATIGVCVAACLQQTWPEIEIIVVDDGSTDHTAGAVREAGANGPFPVHYIRQEHRGPAAARNRGASEANGSVLAFTDADCIPARDWIARLMDGFQEGVVGVGGTYGIANPGSLLARMVHEEIIQRHRRFGRKVDFLGSYNVAYRRDAFEAVGGFDESFSRASAEDNDLAYRLAEAGGALGFVREAVVAHRHPAQLGPYLRTQMRHGFWRMKLYAKHPRRAPRGDRYAGVDELALPPLALLVLVLLVLTASLAPWTPAPRILNGILFAAMVVYVGLRLGLPVRMFARTKDPRMLLFTGVAALRDAARALGMIGGVWRFFVREKVRG